MRSVCRFLPRFDALESIVSLSDLLSVSPSNTWLSNPTTTQNSIPSVTVPLTTVAPSQSLIDPTGTLPGVDGVMPTTPGVNLDVYPPPASYVVPGVLAVPGIPQVPVTPQDPSGIVAPAPSVPKLPMNPVPYFPPPYGIPTYVTLSSVPVTNIS